MLTKIKFENFTAFRSLEIPFSPGINIFVGENGTGKTHILKAAYSACAVVKKHGNFAELVNEVFLPSGWQFGRLIKRTKEKITGGYSVFRTTQDGSNVFIELRFSNREIDPEKDFVKESKKSWFDERLDSVYIPIKDMLANAPGYLSLASERKTHFEKTYEDILLKAYLPFLKVLDKPRLPMLTKLQKAMNGTVEIKGEEFFLRNKSGLLEFSLLAEGYRKLGLLWLLIQNGALQKGSVLFWDEPETNLNPKMMRLVVEILLELQRLGTQIFLATHDSVLLKEFDLQLKKGDQILFHSLFRSKSDEIEIASTEIHDEITPNAIDDAFGSLIDRDIQKQWSGSIGKGKKHEYNYR